jgi:hypothetical protein
MKKEIATLIEAIKADYFRWTERCAKGELSDVNNSMIAAFNETIRVEEGRKYIKVITGSSVWGFVVKGDNDKLFRKGDILKAAGWKAPARNKPRGNIIDGGYSISWTGPHYLI